MCYITATELKNNLGHYMELSKTDPVIVTKNKKVVTVLIDENTFKAIMVEKFRGVCGHVDENVDYDELLKKEILARCG